jgi:MFS family permease
LSIQPDQALAARRERWLMWAILASQFAPAYMFSGVAVALPHLSRDLEASARELGLVETLFLAGSASFLLPIGRWADATDARTLYRVGLYLFAVLTFCLAYASDMTVVLGLRFLQGACAAVVTTTGPAILTQLVPLERRGRVFGTAIAFTYAGLSIGPLCAGWLVEWGGWRAVFAGGGALLVLFALPVQLLMHCRWKQADHPPVHRPSAALLAAAVLCVVYGSAFWQDGFDGALALLTGVLLAVLFVVLQRRLARPLLDLDSLRGNRVLQAALAVQALLYMNAYVNIVLLSLHMQVVLGLSAASTGILLAIGAAWMACWAPFSGVLADRWQPRRIAALGVATIVLMALCATQLSTERGTWFVLLLLALHGVGFALFSTPNMLVIMGAMRASHMNTASALGAKSRSLGMIGGMLVLAVLVSSGLGAGAIDSNPQALVQVTRSAYGVLSVCGAGALALAFVSRNVKETGQGAP